MAAASGEDPGGGEADSRLREGIRSTEREPTGQFITVVIVCSQIVDLHSFVPTRSFGKISHGNCLDCTIGHIRICFCDTILDPVECPSETKVVRSRKAIAILLEQAYDGSYTSRAGCTATTLMRNHKHGSLSSPVSLLLRRAERRRLHLQA